MLNREIRIGLVKGSRKNAISEAPKPVDPNEYVVATAELGQAIGLSVIKGVAVYVALDTIRKIAVNRLSK